MSIPILGIGVPEALLILVITLLVVGPQRFPEIMRQMGHWYRIARGFTTEVMKDVRAAVDEIEQEVKSETDDLQSVRDLADVRTEVERDFQTAKAEADEAGRETAAVARSASETANGSVEAKPRETRSLAERRQASAPRSTGRNTSRPGGSGPVNQPSTDAGATRPQDDPFKALEARQAAAARASQRRGETAEEADGA